MGLAEPRKRIKISNDPRNTLWTNATDSYGHRLMQQQGWKAGEALGAQGKGSNYADAEAAKVNVKYKDDMLGLGASLKSRDIANQRTGFDAFQGLLGRLNAKTEADVQAVEKKLEDKKLAMFAQGRWGGMIFVPGGLLVQSDPYKQIQALKAAEQTNKDSQPKEESDKQEARPDSKESTDETTEKAVRKAEKKLRKEEKRLRKEAKMLKKQARTDSSSDENGLPTPDSSSSNETQKKSKSKNKSESKSKKREHSPEPAQEEASRVEVKPVVVVTAPASKPVRTGRQLLRGKNIQAKRMAFSDMKGLDEIFMKVG